jgi:hypothetical protein
MKTKNKIRVLYSEGQFKEFPTLKAAVRFVNCELGLMDFRGRSLKIADLPMAFYETHADYLKSNASSVMVGIK